MRAHDESRHASTLRDYLHVIRRRKWIILQAVVLVPAVAFYFSHRQHATYQAGAQVLLSQQNLANALTGVSDSTVFQTVDRIAQTQANLARVPRVAQDAIERSHVRTRDAGQLLSESSVTADPNSNILYFDVTDTSPTIAAILATNYAHAFVSYRHELDTNSLQDARADLETRMKELRDRGFGRSRLYASLADKDETLRTMEALQTSNASVIREARGAFQVGPNTRRDTMLGLALGIILGLGLAFLREALDTRVRSAEEISERLGLPILGRLSEPPRRLRRNDQLVTLEDPNSPHAEAFRILRTNLDFARLGHDARTIMITSAVEGEGKSTTAANLAISLARVGKRVALIDLDLRRPYLHRFFRTTGPGLTQVALGYADLREALVPVPFATHTSRPTRAAQASRQRTGRPLAPTAVADAQTNGKKLVEGMLEVLPAGPIPPNVDEFVGTKAVAGIIEEIASRVDIVLIDATPLLVVGDAMALTSHVDALLVVTRMNVVRRPMLREIRRVLDQVPTQKLGFIVTGAGEETGYYDNDAMYRYRAYRPDEKERVA